MTTQIFLCLAAIAMMPVVWAMYKDSAKVCEEMQEIINRFEPKD
jgi:hypothetical protein